MESGDNKLPLIFFICLIIGGLLIVNFLQKPNSISPNLANNTAQAYFAGNQNPTFAVSANGTDQEIQNNTKVYDPRGKIVEIPVKITDNGSGKQITLEKTSSFAPGKYTFVYDNNGKKIEQNFVWGVLAINPNKSIYSPGETADLALAVLDQTGLMVCDANVTLSIKDPKGQTTTLSTQNGTITVNPECKLKKMTYNPDYETKYTVGAAGNYQMSLTAVTKNGTFSIQDYFSAQNTIVYDVERITATRIFPQDAYPVKIKITANQDFTGQIEEIAPSILKISPLTGSVQYSSIQQNGKDQNIIWNLSIKKGETVSLGYIYNAPLISPQFYLLGPLSMSSGGTTVFEENRQWQLAIDAPIAVRSVSNGGTTGNITSFDVNVPSGIANGDVLLAFEITNNQDSVYTPPVPTGFTQLDVNIQGPAGTGLILSVFYRVCDGTEGPTVTFFPGVATGGPLAVQMVDLTGVDTTTPIDQHSINVGATSGTSISITGITPTQDNEMVLVAAGAKTSTATNPITQPSGYTDQGTGTTNSGSPTRDVEVSSLLQTTAAATGTLTATSTNTLVFSYGAILSLNPLATPTPTPTPTPLPGNSNMQFQGVQMQGIQVK